MMFFEVKMTQHRCLSCNYKLNWKNQKKNVCKSKLTIKNVLPNIFTGLSVRKKTRLMF